MNLRTDLTALECDRFRRDCNFTPQERQVFDLRVQDKSIVEICLALNMSEATVSRRISGIKKKILRVI